MRRGTLGFICLIFIAFLFINKPVTVGAQEVAAGAGGAEVEVQAEVSAGGGGEAAAEGGQAEAGALSEGAEAEAGMETGETEADLEADLDGELEGEELEGELEEELEDATMEELDAGGEQGAETEGLSPAEEFVSGRISPRISTRIRQYGYNLFRRAPSTFASVKNIPVSPDYVIGPGDTVRIAVWGKVEGNWSVEVNRDGNLTLPNIGVIGVTGLTFGELKELLEKEFSKYFTGFEMNVAMGSLRTIRVYVVGNARKPGSYTVSSLSTLVGAIFASGGPAKSGSMRNIQLRRSGETLVEFDLYDLILKGDRSSDLRLLPEDVIYIPPVGELVGIAGRVNTPAIYELKDETTILDALEMAGGITPGGYLKRVQVERVYENQVKTIVDINLKELTEEQNITLRDGDIVKVFPISSVIINAVNLKGNVVRPGRYEWTEGMRVSDLIDEPEEDLLPRTYYDHALIERLVPPDYHPELISINLGDAIFGKKPSADITFEPYDTLHIYSDKDFRLLWKVGIRGAVNVKGNYRYRPNMRVSDLVKLAKGLKRADHPESYRREAMIIRRVPPDYHKETIRFDFQKAVVEQDEGEDRLLMPMDVVRIFDIWELAESKKVRVSGALNNPGAYEYTENMRVSDLVSMAGGLKYFAYPEKAELTRIQVTSDGPVTERIWVDLDAALAGNPEENIKLERNDYLFVRTVPNWKLYETVELGGEVRFPGNYTIKEGERLSSLLERAGGLTEEAYTYGAVLKRDRVKKVQENQIRKMVRRLEREILSAGSVETSTALSADEASIQQQETQQKLRFIQTLKDIEATGRLAINLLPPEELEGTVFDIELEAGDTLFVPKNPGTIQVVGSVFNQSAFIYDEALGYEQYIDRAGGFTRNADDDYVYIVKADGTAMKPGSGDFISWNSGTNRWETGESLMPGDTIVVPEKLEKTAWLKNIKDITQIIYQIAVTAGVLIVGY